MLTKPDCPDRCEPRLPDHLRFVLSWASDPLRVAAIAPSGAALARLITREITVQHAPVLELGPGTGVFTRALIDAGLDPADLTLIEFGQAFAALLQARYPAARVLHADAARISARELFPDVKAGAVISGLGLLSMRPRTVFAILHNAFDCLRPDGAFYQFTYGARCPVPRPILDRLGLKASRTGGTVRNLPPASVYRISRRTPRHRVA
ncbi:class I SAM-dependent methyltransferase [Methylobrevis albus]|uniref:Methyltransferase domain-containing protein n=1 Tax=Methylobrevis albus TaxID=2793297 RepID=A0A931I2K7_9HYPH|nr:methyltransferase domain-containing protein [Methylobrevis albus]MBH0239085.1 methyltransferase domain-containing protein [Methylobrevis albus]